MTARRADRRTTLWVRERHVAEAIAQSRRNPFLPQYPLSPAITDTANAATRPHVVVEGAVNARSITALARRLGVDMPICEAVDDIVHHGHPIDQAIQRLLMRPIRAESESARPHPAPTRQPAELLPA
jgi:glycerol-3-phosphate dehydrogenase